jgi:1-deoxy-D-xylulose-5-phosphate synthase
MSISKSVGNIKNILSRFLSNPTSNKFYYNLVSFLEKIPNGGNFLARQGKKITLSLKNLVSPATFFEQFGLSYIGPIDGHDIKKIVDTLKKIKNHNMPVIIHALTTKGKGMPIAIENPTPYHGVKPFDIETGKFHSFFLKKTSFPEIFGKTMLEIARKDKNLVVISPAMLTGSCLTEMKKEFPDRCLDVGIAENHCVTFAGALAKKGNKKVVVCIYSTFFQRALDNVFQDVCLQESPVVFALDRSGLSGKDGVTHHGIYDIGFLNSMPNIIITQPRNGHILKELLYTAFDWKKPVVIRYPNHSTKKPNQIINKRELGKGEVLSEGKDFLIIAVGEMCTTALEIKDKLQKDYNITASVIDPVFIKPLDKDLFIKFLSSHSYVITLEENSIKAGFSMIFNSFLLENNFNNIKVLNIGIPDVFVHHGKDDDLKKELALDNDSIVKRIIEQFSLTKKELATQKI